MGRKYSKLLKRNETYIFFILILLAGLIQMRSGQFFTSNNIVDIASAMIVPGMFAVAEFLVILSGGIDVSFPALASLTAYATTSYLLNSGYEGNVLVPLFLAAVIGAALGSVNGFFVGYLKFPAMIVTLGTSSIFKGIMQGTLQSRQLAVIPKGMEQFGTGALFTAKNEVSGLSSRLPIAFLLLVGVVCMVFLVLRFTMFGRGIYAIGGNEDSAYNAGFRVKRTKFLLYVFSGMIAGVAGIIRVCMMQQCHPTNMLGMEMNIIAGVVLGGTAIVGGFGTLTGCMLGTLLIVLVENSMILIGVPVVWKNAFVGMLIVVGTAVSAYQSAHKGSKAIWRTREKEAV